MSATILQFPPKSKTTRLARGMIDVTPVDKRGFVMLDACIPSWLSIEFMHLMSKYQGGNMSKYQGGNVAPVPHGVKAYLDAKYRFSSVQPEHDGLVLIEACIPLEMAAELCAVAAQERQSAA
jgi:hypothetical protein